MDKTKSNPAPVEPEPTANTLLAEATDNITPEPEASTNKRHLVWEGHGTGGVWEGKLNGGGALVLGPDIKVVISATDPLGVHPDFAKELAATPHAMIVTD